MSQLIEYAAEIVEVVGPRPAASDGEHEASKIIQERFRDLGLDTSTEEFNSPTASNWVRAIYCLAACLSAVIFFFSSGMAALALVIAILAAVMLVLDLFDRNPLFSLAGRGASQNVVARYIPEGEYNRRRKIVVVAHYDSGRTQLQGNKLIAGYHLALRTLMRAAIIAVPIVIIVGMLPLPDIVALVVSYIALVAGLISLLAALVHVVNNFLPYGTGANCNASGVAALMGIAELLADTAYSKTGRDNSRDRAAESDGSSRYRAAESDGSSRYRAAAKDDNSRNRAADEDSGYRNSGAASGAYATASGAIGDAGDGRAAHSSMQAKPNSDPAASSYPVTSVGDSLSQLSESERHYAPDLRVSNDAIRSRAAELPDSLTVADGQDTAGRAAAGTAAAAGKWAAAGTAAAAGKWAAEGGTAAGQVASGAAAESLAAAGSVAAAGGTAAGKWAVAAQTAGQTATKAAADEESNSNLPDWFVAGKKRGAEKKAEAKGGSASARPVSHSRYANVPSGIDEVAPVMLGSNSARQKADEKEAIMREALREGAGLGTTAAAALAAEVENDNKHSDRYQGNQAAYSAEEMSVQADVSKQYDLASGPPGEASGYDSTYNDNSTGYHDKPTAYRESVAGYHNSSDSYHGRANHQDTSGENGTSNGGFDYLNRGTADASDEPFFSKTKSAARAGELRSRHNDEAQSQVAASTYVKNNASDSPTVNADLSGLDFSAFAVVSHDGLSEAAIVPYSQQSSPGLQASYISQPRYEQPRYEQDRYEQDRYEQPQQPQYGQPQQPQQPRYEQDRYEQPQQPRYEQPQQPQYEQPRYEQGRYSEPAYGARGISEQEAGAAYFPPAPVPSELPPLLFDETEHRTNLPALSAIPSLLNADAQILPVQQATLEQDYYPTSGFMSDADSLVSKTGSFAPLAATGAFSPVGDSLLSSYSGDDIYIDDAEDYDTDANGNNSFSSNPQMTMMPKSRARSFLSRIGDRFSGRKKREELDDSPSTWLGVESDFDARKAGGKIGSWDNFDDEDDSSWKGGAYGGDSYQTNAAAAANFSSELINNEVWLVALGSQEAENAGLKAFFAAHSNDLRGAFIINVDSVGAGDLCYTTREGTFRPRKTDYRLQNLLSDAGKSLGINLEPVQFSGYNTDAAAAQAKGARAISLIGLSDALPVGWRTKADTLGNLKESNIQDVCEIIFEAIINVK